MPGKYSSGQACRSWVLTVNTSLPPTVDTVPGWKPTATRDGIPSTRAMIAIAEAKWTQ